MDLYRFLDFFIFDRMQKIANFDNFFHPFLIELETLFFFGFVDLFTRNFLKKKLDL